MNDVREKLADERVRLEKELGKQKLVSDMGSDTEGAMFDEEADEAEQMSANIGVRQTYKERIAEIDSAMARLDAGTYGVCESCGAAIEYDVLAANPAARLCKACTKQS